VEPAPAPEKPKRPSPKELTWEELVELAKLYFWDPTNRELEEDFAAGCLVRITNIVTAYVHYKFIPEIVIDDAISLAQEKWVRNIRGLRSPEDLKRWLTKVARSAAITEFIRIITGSAEEERHTVPLESTGAEGEIVHTLDREEHREAAEKWLSGSARLAEEPLKNLQRQMILDRVLKIHIERAERRRDRDSGFWIKTFLEEGLPVEEIATKRHSTKDDVYHLFEHDVPALKAIYQELVGSSHA
jgi:hypothetical protein